MDDRWLPWQLYTAMIIFAFDLHNHNPLMGQHPAETSASTFLMLVLNLPNAVTTLTQLMLW